LGYPFDNLPIFVNEFVPRVAGRIGFRINITPPDEFRADYITICVLWLVRVAAFMKWAASVAASVTASETASETAMRVAGGRSRLAAGQHG
jgi:hypothetical protein